jgi:hypothetical protein
MVTEQQKEAEANRLWRLYGINDRCEYFWRMAEHSLNKNVHGILLFHIALCLMQRSFGLPSLNWHRGPSTLSIYLGAWSEELDIRHPNNCHQLAAISIRDHSVIVSAVCQTEMRIVSILKSEYEFLLADPQNVLVDKIEESLIKFAKAFYMRGDSESTAMVGSNKLWK